MKVKSFIKKKKKKRKGSHNIFVFTRVLHKNTLNICINFNFNLNRQVNPFVWFDLTHHKRKIKIHQTADIIDHRQCKIAIKHPRCITYLLYCDSPLHELWVLWVVREVCTGTKKSSALYKALLKKVIFYFFISFLELLDHKN